MKKFGNWEPDAAFRKEASEVQDEISLFQTDYSELGIIYKFALECSASVVLGLELVISLLISLTQWTMNRSQIEDKLMAIVEVTYDFIANVADSGAQKSKMKELFDIASQYLLSQAMEIAEEIKEDDMEGYNSLKTLNDDGYRVSASSAASFKAEVQSKGILLWNDDELSVRTKDLSKDNGLALLLSLWNRHTDDDMNKTNSQYKTSDRNVLVINSHIQTAYALYILRLCNTGGFSQRFFWAFMPIQTIKADDIAVSREVSVGGDDSDDNDENDVSNRAHKLLQSTGKKIGQYLEPSLRYHWFFNGKILGPGPTYSIKENQSDGPRSEHERLKALFLCYADSGNDDKTKDTEITLNKNDKGYKMLINDIKTILSSPKHETISANYDQISFDDFCYIMVNDLADCCGTFLKVHPTKILLQKHHILVRKYEMDERVAIFNESSPLWLESFEEVIESPHSVASAIFNWAQELRSGEKSGEIEKAMGAKIGLKTLRLIGPCAVLRQCLDAQKEGYVQSIEFKDPSTKDCFAAWSYSRNIIHKYQLLDKINARLNKGKPSMNFNDDNNQSNSPATIIRRFIAKISKKMTLFTAREVYRNFKHCPTKYAHEILSTLKSSDLLTEPRTGYYTVVANVQTTDPQRKWFIENGLDLVLDWLDPLDLEYDEDDDDAPVNDLAQSVHDDSSLSGNEQISFDSIVNDLSENADNVPRDQLLFAVAVNALSEEKQNVCLPGLKDVVIGSESKSTIESTLQSMKLVKMGDWRGCAVSVRGERSDQTKPYSMKGQKVTTETMAAVESGEKKFIARKMKVNGYPFVRSNMRMELVSGDKRIWKDIERVCIVPDPKINISGFKDVKSYKKYEGSGIYFQFK